MINKTVSAFILAVACLPLVLSLAARQSQNSQPVSSQGHDSKPGMGQGMQGMDMGEAHADSGEPPEAANAANDGMSSRDPDEMDMAHMYMTALRPPNLADQKHADEILAALRPAIERYRDYHVALADGFHIFAPNVPQKIYHFTNNRYGLEAAFKFDPAKPTSLLYKKTEDGGYVLVGAMYTARKRASEEDLNERVPLSVARWHKHVNFCLPPRGTPWKDADMTKFGFGSIATESACEQAGGRWFPQIFGWMLHVYPFESDSAKVWAH